MYTINMTMFDEFVYHVICTGRLLITDLISIVVKGWLMMSLSVVCDVSEGNV